MKTYAVSGPDLLEPFWLNRVRHGHHATAVAADGTVTLDGVALRLRGDAPAPGTALQVWLNGSGFFVCATLDEIEREAQARLDAEDAEANRVREKRNALRIDAEAFNARITLPVKWDVGIKDVLSGLSENSWGDGRSKATVEHILLLEPLRAERLIRDTGDFLCTSMTGSNGRRWSSKVIERASDGSGSEYQPRVTCKACLKLAERWITKNST